MKKTLLVWIVLTVVSSGCSVHKFAVNKVADAIAHSGTTFANDDDPQLIREAVPFGLKLNESLLSETPRHRRLLQATSRGFTQYTYAFLQQEANELEDRDLDAANALYARARLLYLRARDYGLRGLEVKHRGFDQALHKDPVAAVKT